MIRSINVERKMIDNNNIAKMYAESNGYDSVRPSVERNGYRYFHIDYAIRLRYLVYPHIIKNSPIGKFERVLNFDKMYWAVRQANDPLKM